MSSDNGSNSESSSDDETEKIQEKTIKGAAKQKKTIDATLKQNKQKLTFADILKNGEIIPGVEDVEKEG